MAGNPGNGQMSNEQATRNGIQALESAFTGVMRARSDVDSTRSGLAAGYGGSDGAQFGALLAQWDEQANVILKNLEDMITALNQSLQEHHLAQGSSNEAINNAFSKAESVFHTMSGA
ncbi:hypothetical protein ACIRH0_42060 [Streptomyces sp. NPDC093675]|uniref:hypothetical protein n=1 Tax=Streptomyces sp. NPDC093675 TaxID=3366049 RepID=UPI00380A1417